MAKTLPIVVGSAVAIVAVGLAALMWTIQEMPKPELLSNVKYSSAVYDRDGKLLRLSLAEDGTYRLPVKLRDISPDLVKTTLTYEDRYFYEHPGVNPLSLIRASVQSLLGRPIGASTITMQVARIEQNLNTKTLRGKLDQILWALRYEAAYGKDELLEAYFTLVPYGGNVEGLAAASQIYFHKPASALLPSESTALTVIPQNPVKRNPITGSEAFESARAQLAKSLIANEVFPARLESALLSPIPKENFTRLPFAAPHYVRQVQSEFPRAARIEGSLSLALNERLTQVIKRHVDSLSIYGIKNAALFLMDTRTGEVLADIGSADFFNDEIEGEVDGTRAIRSVGSTLKPFIYALALDQGLIHSSSILLDEPKNWRGYQPKNEDGHFMGPLPATEALVKSRNIPALTLESSLHPDLYDLLQTAGANLPQGKYYYGLPIALGTAGLSMQKLTALYSALANQGIMREIVLTRAQGEAQSTPLISAESAWVVRAMLESAGYKVTSRSLMVPLAIKTGTSNGYRDAWAAGLVGPYAMTVWLGNFNSRPNAKLKGADVATPLFVDAASALVNTSGFEISAKELSQEEERPEGVTEVEVCRYTGDLAKDPQGVARCTETTKAWFIPGKSPIAESGWLKRISVDPTTGLRTCALGVGETRYVESWPTHLVTLAMRQGHTPEALPDWAPGCAPQAARQNAPQIRQPAEGAVFFVGTASPTEASVALRASAHEGVKKLYWYDKSVYLGESRPGEVFSATLSLGKHLIAVTDDEGQSAQVTVTVKRP